MFAILVEDPWKFPKNITRVLINESVIFYFCWSLTATLNSSLFFILNAIVLQRSSIVTLCFMKNSFSLWCHNHTHLVWLDSLTILSRTFLRVLLVINEPLFRAYPKEYKCPENSQTNYLHSIYWITCTEDKNKYIALKSHKKCDFLFFDRKLLATTLLFLLPHFFSYTHNFLLQALALRVALGWSKALKVGLHNLNFRC